MAEPAEPPEGDRSIDDLIADVYAAAGRVIAAHEKAKAGSEKDGKDAEDEDEPEAKPKNLKEAERVAYTRVRAHNRRLRATQSGTPDAT